MFAVIKKHNMDKEMRLRIGLAVAILIVIAVGYQLKSQSAGKKVDGNNTENTLDISNQIYPSDQIQYVDKDKQLYEDLMNSSGNSVLHDDATKQLTDFRSNNSIQVTDWVATVETVTESSLYIGCNCVMNCIGYRDVPYTFYCNLSLDEIRTLRSGVKIRFNGKKKFHMLTGYSFSDVTFSLLVDAEKSKVYGYAQIAAPTNLETTDSISGDSHQQKKVVYDTVRYETKALKLHCEHLNDIYARESSTFSSIEVAEAGLKQNDIVMLFTEIDQVYITYSDGESSAVGLVIASQRNGKSIKYEKLEKDGHHGALRVFADHLMELVAIYSGHKLKIQKRATTDI